MLRLLRRDVARMAAPRPHEGNPARGDHDRPAALTAVARRPWLTALGVLALLVALLIALWDWNWFKPLVERQVEARTGRQFEITGNLDVDHLGWTPVVVVGGPRFGNAAWSKEPMMATADRLQLAIALKPLLFHREVSVPMLRLTKPHLRLEVGPGGVGNWKFGEPSTRPARYGGLRIDDGELVFLDAAKRTDIKIALRSDPAQPASAAPPILAAGDGHWKGRAFTVEGRAESPLALRETTRPYRIDARATAGSTHAHDRDAARVGESRI